MKSLIILSLFISTLVHAQDKDCLNEYRSKAKAKRTRYNEQMKRHYTGTWVNLGGQYVRLQSNNTSSPSDYYNNYEEDILKLVDENYSNNSLYIPDGVKEIVDRVQKRVDVEYSDISKFVKEGLESGQFCKSLFGRYGRAGVARYVIKRIKNEQENIVLATDHPEVSEDTMTRDSEAPQTESNTIDTTQM